VRSSTIFEIEHSVQNGPALRGSLWSGVPSGVPGFRAARGGPLVKVEVTAGPARHDALHVCPLKQI
jgi:hypothetical protein